MSSSYITLALVCLALPGVVQIAPDKLAQNREIPENVRVAFNRLAAGELSGEEDAIEQLGKAPGISAALMKLLNATYHGNHDYPLMRSVMAVLQLRSDLSTEQQQWLRKELRAVWNRPDDTKTVSLKDCGLKLLMRYPSAENEEVMILYLKEQANNKVIGYSRMAVYGLEQIGTSKSLPALKEYLKQMPASNSIDELRRNNVKRVIHHIEKKSQLSP